MPADCMSMIVYFLIIFSAELLPYNIAVGIVWITAAANTFCASLKWIGHPTCYM